MKQPMLNICQKENVMTKETNKPTLIGNLSLTNEQ